MRLYTVENKEFRLSIISTLLELSDLSFQEREWHNNKSNTCFYPSMRLGFDFLFNSLGLEPDDSNYIIGYILKSKNEQTYFNSFLCHFYEWYMSGNDEPDSYYWTTMDVLKHVMLQL